MDEITKLFAMSQDVTLKLLGTIGDTLMVLTEEMAEMNRKMEAALDTTPADFEVSGGEG